MSNSHMTQEWVVKNFLPNYEKHHRDVYICNARDDLPHEEVERRFVEHFFPEALSELLKAQKVECSNELSRRESQRRLSPHEVHCAIYGAPIPEPKNRK